MRIPKTVVVLALLLNGFLGFKLFERQPDIHIIHVLRSGNGVGAPAAATCAPESAGRSTASTFSELRPNSEIAKQVREYCDTSWLAREVLEFQGVAADLYRSCGDSQSSASVDACRQLYEKSRSLGETNYEPLAWRAIENKCYLEHSIEACDVAYSIESKNKNFESAFNFAREACNRGDLYSCDLAAVMTAHFDAEPDQIFYLLKQQCRLQTQDGVAQGFCDRVLESDRLTPELLEIIKQKRDGSANSIVIPGTLDDQDK